MLRQLFLKPDTQEIAFDPMGPEETDMFIILKPADQWKSAKTQAEVESIIVDRIRTTVPGAIFSVRNPSNRE